MPKPGKLLKMRIPPYSHPRNSWRAQLNALLVDEARKRRLKYKKSDRLEVNVRLYMDTASLEIHDVDNRLKDILDAVQGRAGGSKAKRRFPAVIPNDSQIFRASIESPNHRSKVMDLDIL